MLTGKVEFKARTSILDGILNAKQTAGPRNPPLAKAGWEEFFLQSVLDGVLGLVSNDGG